MTPSEIRGPDPAGVVADANRAGLEHVVIGGFAVIAHGYFRATKDSDLLVPDGPGGPALLRAALRSVVGFNGELPIDPIPASIRS